MSVVLSALVPVLHQLREEQLPKCQNGLLQSGLASGRVADVIATPSHVSATGSDMLAIRETKDQASALCCVSLHGELFNAVLQFVIAQD